MAFAPRPGRSTPADTGTTPSRSKSSVKSAEGKAAQRKRNREAGNISPSGSSGAAQSIAKAPKRLWEEVEHEVKHLCDIAGKISHSQVGSSGYLISTMSTPLEYAHDLLDVHLKARDGLVYMRIYYVSLEDYLGPIDGIDADCNLTPLDATADGDLDDTFDPFQLGGA